MKKLEKTIDCLKAMEDVLEKRRADNPTAKELIEQAEKEAAELEKTEPQREIARLRSQVDCLRTAIEAIQSFSEMSDDLIGSGHIPEDSSSELIMIIWRMASQALRLDGMRPQ